MIRQQKLSEFDAEIEPIMSDVMFDVMALVSRFIHQAIRLGMDRADVIAVIKNSWKTVAADARRGSETGAGDDVR